MKRSYNINWSWNLSISFYDVIILNNAIWFEMYSFIGWYFVFNWANEQKNQPIN
jgi:hypothetical protein